jgi:RNA 3'-terminal phosphate cyclase (ATP)
MEALVLTIDGSIGEGGGQILRTALTLSICLMRPFRIVGIRPRRSPPGLRPQHLTAVRAAAEVSNARVDGAIVGASELTFAPQHVAAGDHVFSIGTAGSTTLVLQTVLPALLTAVGRSSVVLEGGTHNPQAPTFEFLAKAYVPLIQRMGPQIRIELLRAGFFPKGGGRIRAVIQPSAGLEPLRLHSRGELERLDVDVLLSRLPRHIGDREIRVLRDMLPVDAASTTLRTIDSASPGNVVSICCAFEHVTEVFDAVGRRGVPAERVAQEAAEPMRRYWDSGAPVGEHLADQLLLPLALAGSGSFVTLPPSRHTQTNICVIEQFLGAVIRCAPVDGTQRWRIEAQRG